MTGRARRVALVTGAGTRVGRAIAVGLGHDGWTVALHHRRNAAGARAALAEIRAAGGDGALFGADLTRAGAPARLVASVVRRFGRLDALVNSAASMTRAPIGRIRERDWDEVMALNLRAPFFCSIAAAAAMGKRGGAIVNIGDHMSTESWPGYEAHRVSKAGVITVTEALAAALAPRVRVNAVVPGFVLAPKGTPVRLVRAFERATPLRRIGSPDDVVGAVRYLLGAGYATGTVVFVDGGRRGAR